MMCYYLNVQFQDQRAKGAPHGHLNNTSNGFFEVEDKNCLNFSAM